MNLWVKANHGDSQPGHVWWPMVKCKSRYKHVTPQKDAIEGPSKSKSGSSSWYVTNLPRLVAIVVEICF